MFKKLEEKLKDNNVSLKDFAVAILLTNIPEIFVENYDIENNIAKFIACIYVDENGEIKSALLEFLEKIATDNDLSEKFKNLAPYILKARQAFKAFGTDIEIESYLILSLLESIIIEDDKLLNEYKKILKEIQEQQIEVNEGNIIIK
jgi:hypothetical protein